MRILLDKQPWTRPRFGRPENQLRAASRLTTAARCSAAALLLVVPLW
jgi:hypothetical protein